MLWKEETLQENGHAVVNPITSDLTLDVHMTKRVGLCYVKNRSSFACEKAHVAVAFFQ